MVNELNGFLFDFIAYELTYNTNRTMHTTPRIKIDTLIDFVWSSLSGCDIRCCVCVKVDSPTLKYEPLDRFIVLVAFFDTDCGVFDVEV